MLSSTSIAALAASGADLARLLPRQIEQIVRDFADYGWRDLFWSLGAIAVALIVGRLVSGLVVRALARWSERTDTIVDDAIAKHVHRPLRWMGPLVALNLVLPLLTLPSGPMGFLKHTLLILLILGFGWIAIKGVRVVEEVVTHRFDISAKDNLHARAVYTQMRGFRNIAGFLVGMLTVAFVLMTFERVRQLGAGLLASAGVAGIVLGFAAQKSLATILAGIQIALTQPIRVEDVVIVEGEWGTIEEITLTYVVVRIWDMRRLIVPIHYFIEKPFQNWTRVSADILGTVNLYLDYSVPVEALREEFKRILDASDYWDGETWGVQVTDSTDKTMTVRPLMSAKNSGDAWNLRCEVREKLIAFVRENYPDALPRIRAEVDSGGGSKAA
jgi:small-conductance mechanosensitive channel